MTRILGKLLLTAAFGCALAGWGAPAMAQKGGGSGSADDILGGIGDVPDKAPEKTQAPPNIDTEGSLSGAEKKKDTALEAAPTADVTATPGAVDRIKAVPRKRMLKRRRVELSPMGSLSINDPYIQHFAFGAAIVAYPHDSFGIGLGGDFIYANVERDNVDVIRRGATAVLATFEGPRIFLHADAHWIPIYGKVSLFDSFIVHFDLYGTAGFGVAMAGERRLPAATVAVGQRFVLSDWLALRLEARDYVFLDTQNASGHVRSDIQNFVMVMAGVSFFVPPSFEYTYR